MSKTLDVLGKGVFVAQTGTQLFGLGIDIKGDLESSGLSFGSISSETRQKAGQLLLDVGFGVIGLAGIPGAGISLSYSYREEIQSASDSLHERNSTTFPKLNLNNVIFK